MKTVLVVDDHEEMREVVRLALEDRANCLLAGNLKDASGLVKDYWDKIDAILMDGSVSSGDIESDQDLTPEKWVRRLREFFPDLDIIAFSANLSSQKGLMNAGCNKQFAKGKDSLGWLLALLGLE